MIKSRILRAVVWAVPFCVLLALAWRVKLQIDHPPATPKDRLLQSSLQKAGRVTLVYGNEHRSLDVREFRALIRDVYLHRTPPTGGINTDIGLVLRVGPGKNTRRIGDIRFNSTDGRAFYQWFRAGSQELHPASAKRLMRWIEPQLR